MFQRIVACLLIFVQSYLIVNYSKQPVIPLLASLIAIVGIVPRIRIPFNRIAWNITVFALVPIFIVRGFLVPAHSQFPWYIPCEVMVPLAEAFLVLQVLEILRKRPGDILPIHFVLYTLLTVMFSFCRATGLVDGNTLFWGAVFTATLVGLLLQASRNQAFHQPDDMRVLKLIESRNPRKFPTLGRWLLLLGSFAGVTFGTWYFEGVLSRNVEYFKFFVASNAPIQRDESGSLNYIQIARLDSIKKSQLANSDAVALTAWCDNMPGYLRGRVFDTYQKNQWFHSNEAGEPQTIPARLTPAKSTAAYPDKMKLRSAQQQVFSISDQQQSPWKSVTVRNDVSRGQVFFTPLGADYIQGGVMTTVQLDSHQVIYRGFLNRTYTSYINRETNEEPEPPEARSELLKIPTDIEPGVLDVARQIFAGRATDAQKISAVERYFASNYSYSLREFKIPRRRDHLSYFVLEKPAAHCEFFASAAVVMLRTEGIPTRYATGYVMNEYSDEASCWLARNRNAHAWCEAYDRDRQRWVIVEATSGIEANRDIWDTSFRNNENQISEAEMAKNIQGVNTSNSFFDWEKIQEILDAAGNAIQIAISLILMALLAAFLAYRRYITWKRNRQGGYDPRFEKESAALRKLEKRLKRLGIIRSDSETLHQFAQRIQALDEEWSGEAASSFLQYAHIRYS